MHFQGPSFKHFLGGHASRPPQTLRPLGPSLHAHRPCFGTEIFHVTTASKLMTALLTSSLYQSKGGFPLSDIFYVHK